MVESWAQPEDWVFPNLKLRGRNYEPQACWCRLRPAAVKAGVLDETDTFRFGFHNLRHPLASFLVRTKTDPKTVQALLRQADVKSTLQLYSHRVREATHTRCLSGRKPSCCARAK